MLVLNDQYYEHFTALGIRYEFISIIFSKIYILGIEYQKIEQFIEQNCTMF